MHEHESIPPSTSLLEVSSCYPPEQDGPIDCDASSAVRTGERGRSPVQVPSLFVSRLYEMLRDCELDKSKGDIVSWLPDGKSFRVHKPKEVIKDILPAYFSQTKYKSFQRQLNLWGFDRITAIGPLKGAYIHPRFQRDLPLCVENLRRIRAIPKVPAKVRRTLLEASSNRELELRKMGDAAAKKAHRKAASKRRTTTATKSKASAASVVSQDLHEGGAIIDDDTPGRSTSDSFSETGTSFWSNVDTFFEEDSCGFSAAAAQPASADGSVFLELVSVLNDDMEELWKTNEFSDILDDSSIALVEVHRTL